MTKLNKTLRREVQLPKFRRPVIVSIDSETKKIILHEKGGRTKYGITIQTLYTLLVIKGEREN